MSISATLTLARGCPPQRLCPALAVSMDIRVLMAMETGFSHHQQPGYGRSGSHFHRISTARSPRLHPYSISLQRTSPARGGRTDSTGRSRAEAAGRNRDMTGSTPAIIIMIIVVMITLAAWIILVFYADAHPEWRRRAPSGHGHGQADGSPGRPTPGTQSPGRAARDTEASAAARRDPGASAAPAAGIYAGRARAD